MLLAIVPAAPPDAEEPAHHFLPGADLGERAVASRVQIDPQRFRMRILHVIVDGKRDHDGILPP